MFNWRHARDPGIISWLAPPPLALQQIVKIFILVDPTSKIIKGFQMLNE